MQKIFIILFLVLAIQQTVSKNIKIREHEEISVDCLQQKCNSTYNACLADKNCKQIIHKCQKNLDLEDKNDQQEFASCISKNKLATKTWNCAVKCDVSKQTFNFEPIEMEHQDEQLPPVQVCLQKRCNTQISTCRASLPCLNKLIDCVTGAEQQDNDQKQQYLMKCFSQDQQANALVKCVVTNVQKCANKNQQIEDNLMYYISNNIDYSNEENN